jgi:hypothetical protein
MFIDVSDTKNTLTCEKSTQTDALPVSITTQPPQERGSPSTRPSTSKAPDEKCSHPVYGTYFKMLAKKVPKPAVQHKMRMNGLDPAVLDMESLDTLQRPVNAHAQQDVLTLSLKDDHQLKKTEINQHEKKLSNSAGHGLSLHEIVNGLKSLRKTILPPKETSTKHTSTLSESINTFAKISLKSTKSNSFMRLLGSTFQS